MEISSQRQEQRYSSITDKWVTNLRRKMQKLRMTLLCSSKDSFILYYYGTEPCVHLQKARCAIRLSLLEAHQSPLREGSAVAQWDEKWEAWFSDFKLKSFFCSMCYVLFVIIRVAEVVLFLSSSRCCAAMIIFLMSDESPLPQSRDEMKFRLECDRVENLPIRLARNERLC